MQDQLFDSLEFGATAVTVNHRLARDLRSRYTVRQVERGLSTWRTPSIASFDAWCEALWNDCVDAGVHADLRLPGVAQEEALWERIVDESPEGHGVIQTSRTATQALDAWHLAAVWAIAVPVEHDADLSDDCRAFARWSARYRRELIERGWIDRARLPEKLVEALAAGLLDAPKSIWLAGFDEMTPQQLGLIEALRRAGTGVEVFAPKPHDAEIVALALADAEEELRCAARWARELLERGELGTIGVVVPGLQSVRPRVEAIFSDYLIPSEVLAESPEQSRPFNISSGRPLSDYPIVATALIALELCAGDVPIERAGALLRSPFIGGADQELSSRALLDARLRRNGRTAVGAEEILRMAARTRRATGDGHASGDGHATGGGRASGVSLATGDVRATRDGRALGDGGATVAGGSSGDVRALGDVRASGDDREVPATYACPRLAERLRAWQSAVRELTPATRLAPSRWAEVFAEALKELGWPGDRIVSSAEHQALEKWWELIATYATLDGIVEDERPTGAVRRLARMAAGTDFQPRTDQAPVQILGTLEAAAMRFEHLWITGMHDEEMPATPKPNPFLPIRLQRAHRVARASAERELEFARAVVNGLIAAAPYVVISHPLSDGDRPLAPSPLIVHLDPRPPEDSASLAAGLFSTIIHESAALESLVDEVGPPVTAGAAISGGTSILKDQAACPFRAFATHRLGARPLDRPSPGLDSMERGKLMHEVLESFWLEQRTHAALMTIGDGDLDDAIARHVDIAVERFAAMHPETFSSRFAAIERRRLGAIVRVWLEAERQRMPFSVRDVEHERDVTIGGITMSVRVDRIDELDDGRRIFIDYKTSRPSWRKWFGPRPDEPQLPIYCLDAEEVAAVLFVQLKPDSVKFIGIAADDGIVPGIRGFEGLSDEDIGSWDEINPRWSLVLARIGEAFLGGEAAVDPKDPVQTCKYCELGPLCRVRELGVQEEVTE